MPRPRSANGAASTPAATAPPSIAPPSAIIADASAQCRERYEDAGGQPERTTAPQAEDAQHVPHAAPRAGDGAAVADVEPPAGEAVRRGGVAGQDHRPAQRQATQTIQHLAPRWPDRDAPWVRPAAAGVRSSGTRGRSPRAAPGRRTGRSRPRPPWCRGHPAVRRRTRSTLALRAASSTSASVASGRAKRMLSRMLPANSTGR